MLDSTLIDKLAPWPALQFAAAFLLVLFGLLIAWKALKQPPPAAPTPSPPQTSYAQAQGAGISESLVFFQGPFQAIIDRLDTAVLTMERMGGLSSEMKEVFSEHLRSTRHDLKAVLQLMSQAQERDADEIKNLVRSIEKGLGEVMRDFDRALAELRLDIVRGKGK